MTPDEIARGIVDTIRDKMDSRVWQEEDENTYMGLIVTSLREYGEACVSNSWRESMAPGGVCAEAEKKADAEGYRRGVEESAKIARSNYFVALSRQGPAEDWLVGKILALLQRGTGGGE